MSNQQLIQQRQNQLKPLLVSAQRQITSLLQDDAKAKRFMAASLVVASNPLLNKCSPESIVQALVGVAMSDLNIDSNIGHCYLVPYGDSVQLQIGYKGFIQLLFRAGWLVKSFPVYTCDDFEMSFDGWDNRVEFKPNIDARDEGDKEWCFNNLRGVYVVSRHADTKDEYSMFVNKTVIEKLRLNSPNQRIGNYTKPADKEKLQKGIPIGIWFDWYVEMSQSKAIKKLAKILPIGDSRAQMVIASDDKSDSGSSIDYKQSAENGVVIELNSNDEKTVSGSSTTGISIEDVLELIASATSKNDLEAIAKSFNDLPDKDQKAAKSAWITKNESFKLAKKQEKTTKENPINWEQSIKECGDKAALDALMLDMPESVQIEFGDVIDEKFDSFR